MPRTGFEKRKATNNPERKGNPTQKKSFRKRSADAPTFDTLPADKLHALVCLATTYNASPTFSYTRDGTSLVMAIYYEGERYVDYLSGPDDFNEYFGWVVEELLEVDDITLKPYAHMLSEKL